MPVITISGLPADISEEQLHLLRSHLRQGVADIKSLNIKKGDVTVVYVAERALQKKCEVIATVSKLLDKPQRTAQVRDRLASRITHILGICFEKHTTVTLIEVFIEQPFKPEWGYCRIKKRKK